MKIELTPKTKHGKDRIKKHGNVWLVVREEKGSFLLKSLNDTFMLMGRKIPDFRRIDKNNDRDFDWRIIDGKVAMA